MLTFKDFLAERAAPEDIAHRFVRRHSAKPHNDEWQSAKEHGYIKLKQAPEHEVHKALIKMEKIRHLKSSTKTFKIKDLHGTQPIVHHSDDNKFKQKLADKKPSHVSVITHKGKHYIDDGHHSVMAARLRGDTHVTATHHNLDEH